MVIMPLFVDVGLLKLVIPLFEHVFQSFAFILVFLAVMCLYSSMCIQLKLVVPDKLLEFFSSFYVLPV